MPVVSVLLPVFNGEATIARAVASILDQTLREIELIVLDDGSTDETASVVAGFQDPRLRLIRSAHRGVAAAANAALGQAVAPFIARMDSDDFAHPSRLRTQLELLRKQGLDVVGCQVSILDREGESIPSLQRYQRWINQETLDSGRIAALRFVEFPLVNPTLLARRAYFEMGFRDGDFPEDYDLMLRAAARGLRFGKVPRILLDWTDHPDRLTRTDSRYGPDAFMRCRRVHLLGGPLQGLARVDVWGFGQTGKPWLRWLRGQGLSVRRGYDIDGRKVNTSIHGVDVRHPGGMPPADGTPLLIAVGAEGARDTILPQIQARGHVPGGDAWFVA